MLRVRLKTRRVPTSTPEFNKSLRTTVQSWCEHASASVQFSEHLEDNYTTLWRPRLIIGLFFLGLKISLSVISYPNNLQCVPTVR